MKFQPIAPTPIEQFLADCSRFNQTLSELSRGVFSPFEAKYTIPSLSKNKENSQQHLLEAMQKLIVIQKDNERAYNDATGIPCLRLCFVGADSWQEGLHCASLMTHEIPSGGDIAIIIASYAHIGHDLRRRAFQQALQNTKETYRVVCIHETHNIQAELEQALENMLQEFPNLKGIYLTAGSQLGHTARFIEQKYGVRKITLIGHDLLPETVKGLQNRTIAASLGQDPFAQGYNPIIYLYNHIVDSWIPPSFNMSTAQDVFTLENYKEFWDSSQNRLKNASRMERLAVLSKTKPSKQLRLVFLGREDSSFWKDPHAGVLAASEALKGKSCTVEWIVPTKNKEKGDTSSACYGAAIRELIRAQVDGIAVVAQDKGYVQYINEAVDAGISVVTVNTEISGLSSLMFMIRQQLTQIINHSETLMKQMAGSHRAILNVHNSMEELADASQKLQTVVASGSESMNTMTEQLTSVVTEVTESASTIENTRSTVGNGIDATQNTLKGLSSLRNVVDNSWKGLQVLVERSVKIDAIMLSISDIAERIGVLAINATIEAVRAGQHGHGFSIIATEVRNLATQTGGASKEAVALVKAMHGDIKTMEHTLKQGLSTIDESSNKIDETVAMLAEIRIRSEGDAQRARRISSSIEHIHEVSMNIHKNVEGIDMVSKLIDSSVFDVRNAMDTMVKSFEEVSQSAESLSQLAIGEQESLARFKFNDAR